MTYVRTLVAGVFFFVATAAGFSQTATFSASSFLSLSKQSAPRSLASTPFAATQVLNFNTAQAEQILLKTTADKIILRDFPVGNNNYQTVELTRSRPVIDGQTEIRVKTKGGWATVEAPAMVNYRGKIVGEINSSLTIVYAGGDMYAAIRHNDGSQAQIAPSLETNAKGSLLMSSISEGTSMPFTCYSDKLPEYYQPNDGMTYKHNNSIQAADTTLKEAEIVVETDRFIYKTLKSEARIITYVNAVFANVSNKYEDEINVTIRIREMQMYTTDNPDPYAENEKGAAKDIGKMLGQVKDVWVQNFEGIPRDFVHVLTSPGNGSNVGGIAYREQLCSKGLGYGVSGIHCTYNLPILTYIWDSFVVTHEIGHTFSARHTHDCWWNPAIDSCVTQADIDDVCYNNPRKKSSGSIMSYCHVYYGSPLYTFLPKVANVIREYAHTRTCLSVPSPGAVRIIFPLGGIDEIFRSDTTLTVRWTSAKVSTVNVEYTLDSSSGVWQPIAQGISAIPGSTKWTLPSGQASKRCLVRIYDATNPTVGDTSYAVFTMTAASITMVNPLGGERLPRNGTERVTWSMVGVTRCNVEFSPTGSEPWTRLSTNLTASSYNWTIPDIETTTAKIRVMDAVSGSPIAESGLFAIGSPTLALQYPAGGEELCVSSAYQVKWQADFIKTVRVDLSTDGGTTYPITQRLANSLDAKNGQYTWIPHFSKVGTNVRLRVVNTDITQILAESPVFTVKLCATSGVNDDATLEGFEIASLLPNPATQNFTVRLNNNSGSDRQVECALIAADGRSTELGKRLVMGGNNAFEFSVSDIAQGRYMFVVRSNGQQLTMPVVIVR